MRRLKHIADRTVHPKLAAFTQVFTVDKYFALCRLKEATDKVYECGFSRTCFPDYRDVCPERNFQIEMFKDIFFAVRISEGHIAKFDITAQLLPVFGFWFKRIAVFFNNLSRIRNVRDLGDKIGYTLDIDLCRYHVCRYLNYPLYRNRDIHGVCHKYREHTDLFDVFKRDMSALPKHHCKAE